MNAMRSVPLSERPTTVPMAPKPVQMFAETHQVDSVRTPVAPQTSTRHQHGPHYEFYRSRYRRLFGDGCARCGGPSIGWIQRQLQTPKRIMRFILWVANLVPRAVRLWTALTHGYVGWDEYDERQAACGPCSDRVIHLRLLKGAIREKSYCGACDCPKWWFARLDIKNRLRGWRCPMRRHVGSDPYDVYRIHVMGTAAEARQSRTAANDNGDDARGDGSRRGDPNG